MHTGIGDVGALTSTEAIFWLSDTLSYWCNPKCTIDGVPSTLFHVSGIAVTGGYAMNTCKFMSGRSSDLTSIDLTATTSLGQLYPIVPTNELFIALKVYVMKPASTH